jgi:mannose-6-phosphate isomerase-like protein (cupin superfamily)
MARIEKRTIGQVHFAPRGWGHEYWIENLREYCGKVLVIEPGKRGSLHFHMKKTETMMVSYGRMRLRLVDPETAEEYEQHLGPDDSILIPKGQVHQIINDSETHRLILIEFSTQHFEDDSRRVQKGD